MPNIKKSNPAPFNAAYSYLQWVHWTPLDIKRTVRFIARPKFFLGRARFTYMCCFCVDSSLEQLARTQVHTFTLLVLFCEIPHGIYTLTRTTYKDYLDEVYLPAFHFIDRITEDNESAYDRAKAEAVSKAEAAAYLKAYGDKNVLTAFKEMELQKPVVPDDSYAPADLQYGTLPTLNDRMFEDLDVRPRRDQDLDRYDERDYEDMDENEEVDAEVAPPEEVRPNYIMELFSRRLYYNAQFKYVGTFLAQDYLRTYTEVGGRDTSSLPPQHHAYAYRVATKLHSHVQRLNAALYAQADEDYEEYMEEAEYQVKAKNSQSGTQRFVFDEQTTHLEARAIKDQFLADNKIEIPFHLKQRLSEATPKFAPDTVVETPLVLGKFNVPTVYDQVDLDSEKVALPDLITPFECLVAVAPRPVWYFNPYHPQVSALLRKYIRNWSLMERRFKKYSGRKLPKVSERSITLMTENLQQQLMISTIAAFPETFAHFDLYDPITQSKLLTGELPLPDHPLQEEGHGPPIIVNPDANLHNEPRIWCLDAATLTTVMTDQETLNPLHEMNQGRPPLFDVETLFNTFSYEELCRGLGRQALEEEDLNEAENNVEEEYIEDRDALFGDMEDWQDFSESEIETILPAEKYTIPYFGPQDTYTEMPTPEKDEELEGTLTGKAMRREDFDFLSKVLQDETKDLELPAKPMVYSDIVSADISFNGLAERTIHDRGGQLKKQIADIQGSKKTSQVEKIARNPAYEEEKAARAARKVARAEARNAAPSPPTTDESTAAEVLPEELSDEESFTNGNAKDTDASSDDEVPTAPSSSEPGSNSRGVPFARMTPSFPYEFPDNEPASEGEEEPIKKIKKTKPVKIKKTKAEKAETFEKTYVYDIGDKTLFDADQEDGVDPYPEEIIWMSWSKKDFERSQREEVEGVPEDKYTYEEPYTEDSIKEPDTYCWDPDVTTPDSRLDVEKNYGRDNLSPRRLRGLDREFALTLGQNYTHTFPHPDRSTGITIGSSFVPSLINHWVHVHFPLLCILVLWDRELMPYIRRGANIGKIEIIPAESKFFPIRYLDPHLNPHRVRSISDPSADTLQAVAQIRHWLLTFPIRKVWIVRNRLHFFKGRMVQFWLYPWSQIFWRNPNRVVLDVAVMTRSAAASPLLLIGDFCGLLVPQMRMSIRNLYYFFTHIHKTRIHDQNTFMFVGTQSSGKTFLTKAIAGDCGVTIFRLDARELLQKQKIQEAERALMQANEKEWTIDKKSVKVLRNFLGKGDAGYRASILLFENVELLFFYKQEYIKWGPRLLKEYNTFLREKNQDAPSDVIIHTVSSLAWFDRMTLAENFFGNTVFLQLPSLEGRMRIFHMYLDELYLPGQDWSYQAWLLASQLPRIQSGFVTVIASRIRALLVHNHPADEFIRRLHPDDLSLRTDVHSIASVLAARCYDIWYRRNVLPTPHPYTSPGANPDVFPQHQIRMSMRPSRAALTTFNHGLDSITDMTVGESAWKSAKVISLQESDFDRPIPTEPWDTAQQRQFRAYSDVVIPGELYDPLFWHSGNPAALPFRPDSIDGLHD
jgi:hypothetical protein